MTNSTKAPTQRDFAIATIELHNILEAAKANGMELPAGVMDIASELADHAENTIAKLDAANEKRRNAPKRVNTKNAEVNEEIKVAMLLVMKDMADAKSSEIAALVTATGVDCSTPKATAMLKQLVAAELVEVIEPTVKSKPKTYKLV